MVDQHDLALARARVLLAQIAPEIPGDEIVPGADLTDDLGLDLVSVWALATGLEKMAKVEINDADIAAATSLGSLLNHALSDVPLEYQQADEGSGAASDDSKSDAGKSDAGNHADEAATSDDAPDEDDDTPENLQSALEDLADLFNS
ncbi:phosphopantetheine-binding protein [Trueperella sp.]|uniref:phosphopantetheine-binding protein n=1 Tax=Trueperella sp. TaxID=2699835 RepID=UPI003736F71B